MGLLNPLAEQLTLQRKQGGAMKLMALFTAAVLQSAASTDLLRTGIVSTEGTVGILGYRQSLFGHKVVAIHPGSPVAGTLRVGDEIIAVNGNNNCHDTRGEPYTAITLTVRRGGLKYDVTFKRIAVQELKSRYLNHYFGVEN